jgi:hypothetical protein
LRDFWNRRAFVPLIGPSGIGPHEYRLRAATGRDWPPKFIVTGPRLPIKTNRRYTARELCVATQELVREIDDLYDHYFLPVFREWVPRQGDSLPSLPSSGSVTVGSVTWRLEAIDGEIWSEVEKMICLRTTLDVPSYWEIPLLADKKLCLRVLFGDFRRRRSETARYGAGIGGFVRRLPERSPEQLLTIKIGRYTELGWNQEIILKSQGKLRATIAHELEHYLHFLFRDAPYDPPIEDFSKVTLTKHFGYLNHPMEIAATARELIVLAEHYSPSIKDELDHRIEGVRRAVLQNPETNGEKSEIRLMEYRELLAAELVRRLPELSGKL